MALTNIRDPGGPKQHRMLSVMPQGNDWERRYCP